METRSAFGDTKTYFEVVCPFSCCKKYNLFHSSGTPVRVCEHFSHRERSNDYRNELITERFVFVHPGKAVRSHDVKKDHLLVLDAQLKQALRDFEEVCKAHALTLEVARMERKYKLATARAGKYKKKYENLKYRRKKSQNEKTS